MKQFLSASLSILLLTVLGCLQDPTTVPPVTPIPSAKGVYILNEGQWGRGNSTLSYLDLGSYHVYNDVYFAANSRNLGDVGNQIVLRGPLGYIVVNNSDRIEIIELATAKSMGTIDAGSGKSPRQLAFVNDTLALVTNLYDASASLVDLKGRSVLQRIPVGDNPEGIAITAGKAYVANSGFGFGRTLTIIDVTTMTPIGTIEVADNPLGVYITGSGMVYVVCAGAYGDPNNPNDDTPARIMVIDPHTDRLVDSVMIGGHATSMGLSGDGWGYVATTDRVVSIDTRTHSVIGTFVKGNYYGVGVEQVSGDVYLTDVKNYVQPGTVTIFAPTGELRMQFEVGLIPGTFGFKR